MTESTVLYADPKTETDFEWINRLDAAQTLNLVAPADGSDEALMERLPHATVIVTQNRPITAEIIAAAPKLASSSDVGASSTACSTQRSSATSGVPPSSRTRTDAEPALG